jgi:hypothetical protein
MGNIFADLVAKLTRRQKKGKPQPVAAPKPIKAVTYNRVDGVVSGSLLQTGHIGQVITDLPPHQQTPRGAVWDDTAKVYRSAGVRYAETDRAARRRRFDNDREDFDKGDDFGMFVAGTKFDDAFFYVSDSGPAESASKAPDYDGGYTDTAPAVSSSYGGSQGSYGGSETLYSTPSYSGGNDSGSSSSYSPSYSDSSSSSSYSDSGSSGGGSYSD